jgi:branched-chain amino acid transport system permease protein
MDWLKLIESSIAGLATGAVYALVALGFVIIYKSTRVINFALGEIMMFCAYLFLSFIEVVGLPPGLALIAAVIAGGLFGGVTERLIIRPMLGESQITVVMITIGLGSVLVGAAEIIWSADPQVIPTYLPDEPILIGDMYLAPNVAYSALIAIAVLSAGLAYFRFARGGVALRATASEQQAAFSMGINVPRVFNIAWIAGGMAMSLAGILFATSGGLNPHMGGVVLSILVVVILGGLDSVLGALIGGLVVGWVEIMTAAYLGGNYRLMATFVLLAAILVIRPYGLFGTKEIERL